MIIPHAFLFYLDSIALKKQSYFYSLFFIICSCIEPIGNTRKFCLLVPHNLLFHEVLYRKEMTTLKDVKQRKILHFYTIQELIRLCCAHRNKNLLGPCRQVVNMVRLFLLEYTARCLNTVQNPMAC